MASCIIDGFICGYNIAASKKKSLCRDIREARVTEFISDYPLRAHLEVVSEHYRNIFPLKTT